jgi:hypothetical protein
MGAYNAIGKNSEGTVLDRDTVERVIYFGPGRDSTRLTLAVLDILGMRQDGEAGDKPWLSRSVNRKIFKLPPGFAEIVGVDTMPDAAQPGEMATVHDTLSGIITYVGSSALQPDQITPDLARQLQERQPRPEMPKAEPATVQVTVGEVPEGFPDMGAIQTIPEPGVVALA